MTNNKGNVSKKKMGATVIFIYYNSNLFYRQSRHMKFFIFCKNKTCFKNLMYTRKYELLEILI